VAIFLWVITILTTSQKYIKKSYLIILGKKQAIVQKLRHILCNKIVKFLMNAFWIDIEFTKILSWFKQKDICRFIHGI
jgi:hypothetical protein